MAIVRDYQMRLKGATTVLEKQCEFLGLTWDELMVFIERNPYAFPNKAIEAFTVYNKEP
jgi:hypothetical protein